MTLTFVECVEYHDSRNRLLNSVYWHGLMGTKHINEHILKTIERDKKTNDLFLKNDNNLSRVMDEQLQEVVKFSTCSMFETKAKSSKNLTIFDGVPGYMQIDSNERHK